MGLADVDSLFHRWIPFRHQLQESVQTPKKIPLPLDRPVMIPMKGQQLHLLHCENAVP